MTTLPETPEESAAEAVSEIARLFPDGAPERRLSDIVDAVERALEWSPGDARTKNRPRPEDIEDLRALARKIRDLGPATARIPHGAVFSSILENSAGRGPAALGCVRAVRDLWMQYSMFPETDHI